MSRTNRRSKVSSPIKKYISFSGSTGVFSYYDKAKGEKVEIDSISLILMDIRSSITGYNSASKSQISSNYVVNIEEEELKVVTWKGGKSADVAEGLYADIKSKLSSIGGKFTTNLICLADVGDGEEICNIQLTGSSLSSWFEALSSIDEYDSFITLSKGPLSKVDGKEIVPVTEEEEKALLAKIKKNPRVKQPIWFYLIDVDTTELSDEDGKKADELDATLQKYFGASKPKDADTSDDDGYDDEDPEGDEKDDLPF